MVVKVTHSTPADGSFSATGATAWNADHTLTGVGTMAEQDANNVAITGGSITGVSIPVTLTANSTATSGFTNGQVLKSDGTKIQPLTLGTMASQDANNVAITGGSITGVSIPVTLTANSTATSGFTNGQVLKSDGTKIQPLTLGTMAAQDANSVNITGGSISGVTGVAASGSNSDITSLSGLTTPLSVGQGGSGTATPSLVAGAKIAVTGSWPNQTVATTGAAASGANSDITSLAGLTTPLSVGQGGSGTTTPSLVAGAKIAVTGSWPNQTIATTGVAASGSNSDITSLSGLTTPLSVGQGGSGTATPSLVAGAKIAVSGSWPNQTIATTGVAASGANSDITSLSGLTTPLSIAQGGSGTATPSLVAGTNVSISGTWPNQTINATASGSVTSVTASSPLASSGGATPDISLTGVISGTYGGTGVNNGTKTITLGGNFTTSGAFSTTLTATALTTLTLPASGTLISSVTNMAANPVTGTPSSSTYLRGDGTWATISTSGTVTSVAQTFTGGIISVSGSPITTSGTLDLSVAGTSGGIPYFSSGTTWATSAALAANALVVGGGAGAAPSTITTGANVTTALGVNVGTAGAFVVNGGALGTPSSGTLTNATGLPVGGISASGTPSSTTYLRGDGTWSTAIPAYPSSGIAVSTGSAWGTSLTAPSGTIVGTTDTQTLSNKTITARTTSAASTTSPLAWNSDNFDQYIYTALANALTLNADAGTPTLGRKIVFVFTDNGTPRVLTFTGGASKGFQPIGVTMTASGSNWTYTTTANKKVYFGCIYDTNDARWDIVAISQEA